MSLAQHRMAMEMGVVAFGHRYRSHKTYRG